MKWVNKNSLHDAASRMVLGQIINVSSV